MCDIKDVKLKDNAMLKVKPELFNEWDFKKNDELGLNIYEMTKGSHTITWWSCGKNHSWEASIKSRVKGNGCPYCSNQKILVGYNDMWTTNPELASLLLNKEDGYKYAQHSNKKADWKCNNCGEIIRNKVISSVCERGLSCLVCSDTISFPEKIMFYVLRELEIKFESQKVFKWLKNRRYDFYLPNYNIIIETNGEQHYREGFIRAGGKSLKEVQQIDELKKKTAIKNGIDKYIVINCSQSTFEHIKNSIKNSELNKIFNIDSLDWGKIALESSNSLMMLVWSLWDSGLKSSKKISDKTGIGQQVVLRYLKQGQESGKCSYDPKEARKMKDYRKIKIVQLDLNNNFIKEWESIVDATESLNLKSNSGIRYCCKKERETAGGYKWQYAEDYYKNKKE